jgi:hypothetical protein
MLTLSSVRSQDSHSRFKIGGCVSAEVQAKRFIIKQAKQWIDNRLKSAAKIALNRIVKRCTWINGGLQE